MEAGEGPWVGAPVRQGERPQTADGVTLRLSAGMGGSLDGLALTPWFRGQS